MNHRIARTLVILFLASDYAFGDGIRTVALQGQPVPGSETGVLYGELGYPVLNAMGRVAHLGSLTLGNGEVVEAVYSEGSGRGAAVVARAGDAVSPGSTDRFAETADREIFADVTFNAAGEVAFGASLELPADASPYYYGLYPNYSVWAGMRGELRQVVRVLDEAGGGPDGAVFFSARQAVDMSQRRPFDDLRIDPQGRVTFVGNAGDPSDLSNYFRSEPGVWREATSGSVLPVLRPTPLETGPPSGSNYPPSFGAVSFADDGSVSYVEGVLSTADTTPEKLFGYRDGIGKSLLAIEGGFVPGGAVTDRFVHKPHDRHDKGGVFRQLTVAKETGQVAFMARAEHPPESIFEYSEYYWGVWGQRAGGDLGLVAREGGPAPGVDPGLEFGSAFSSVSINSKGEVAFIGHLVEQGVVQGSNVDRPSGIWTQAGSQGLRLTVREGDFAPGLMETTRFGRFSSEAISKAPESVVTNANGQIAFTALLHNAAENSSTSGCSSCPSIWVHDPEDGLTMIIRAGDQIDVSNDPAVEDYRTIRWLRDFTRYPSLDPPAFQFNDRGEVAFWAEFTDGTSGIFVSSLAAIPEPSSVWLVIAMMLKSFAAYRRE